MEVAGDHKEHGFDGVLGVKASEEYVQGRREGRK